MTQSASHDQLDCSDTASVRTRHIVSY